MDHFLTRIMDGLSDKTAVVSGEKRLSYKELKDRSLRLGNGLIDLGLKNKNIAFMLRNSNEFYETYLAPMVSQGGKSTPINYHFIGEEIAYIANHTEANAFIVDEEFVDKVIQIKSKLKDVKEYIVVGDKAPGDMILYEDLIKGSSSRSPEEAISASAGPLIYTGGTTGDPKGVHPMGGLEKGRKTAIEIMQRVRLYNLHKIKNYVHLVAAPLYHAAPFYHSFILVLLNGGCGVMMKKWDSEEALRLIEEEKITTTYMPPILLKRILDVPNRERYDVSSMKVIVCGGAPVPVNVKKGIVEYFGPVYHEFYGALDAPDSTILTPAHYTKNPDKIASVGKASPGTNIKILDEDGTECPCGVPGNLYIKNAYTDSLEYYKDPERTKKAFCSIGGDMYFDEGEIMYMDEDGFFYVVDRRKDLIISGGVNISSAEIEDVIHSHPKVADVAVIGVPDSEWGESVKAFVLLKEKESADEEEITSYCKEKLASYKKPKSVEFVSELPRDPDGKLFKRSLRQKHWQEMDLKV